MQDKTVMFMVGNQCPPDLEEKFNKQFDEVHIPMVLKAERILRATRCKLQETT